MLNVIETNVMPKPLCMQIPMLMTLKQMKSQDIDLWTQWERVRGVA